MENIDTKPIQNNPANRNTTLLKKAFRYIFIPLLFICYSYALFQLGKFSEIRKVIDLQDRINQQNLLIYAFQKHLNIPSVSVQPTQNAITPYITWTQTSDNQSWQQYRNQSLGQGYGISFSYPRNWKIVSYKDDTQSDNGVIAHGLVGLIPQNEPSNLSPVITLRYWDNPKQLTVQEYNKQFYCQSGIDNCLLGIYLDAAQATSISGHTAYYMWKNDRLCDPYFCNVYMIPVGNKIFEVKQFLQYPNHPDISDDDITTIFKTIVTKMTIQ